MKTAVIIIGCMGAGKSTLLAEFAKREIADVKIDECREETQAYLPYLEAEAWERFDELIAVPDLVVAECSGTGRYYQGILSRYPGRVIEVKLTCSMDTIIHRIHRRMRYGYKWPPISWSTDVFTVAKRQFEVLENRPADLVINTEKNSPELAAEIILKSVLLP